MTTTYSAAQIATAWRTLAESHRRDAAAKISGDPQGALTYYAKAAQLEDCARDLEERLAPAPQPVALRLPRQGETDTLAQAQERAARIRAQGASEADYAAIRAYLFTHGWEAASSVHGEEYLRAAMLPTD